MASNKFTAADLVKLQGKGIIIHDPMLKTSIDKAFKIPNEKRSYSNKEKNHIEWVLIGLKLDFKKEFKFHDTRKFKFDWCVPYYKIAIEYEGIYGGEQSRHTNVTGYSNDVVKYNLATVGGWRVLRYTANNYMSVGTDLEKLLTNK